MYEDNDRDREAAMIMRIGRTEEYMSQSERRLQILEENDRSFEKLASTLELIQRLDSEKQKHQEYIDRQYQTQMEKFSNTLERMNNSFTHINDSMQQLYTANRDIITKMDNIETDVAGVKAKVEEMEKDDTINWKKGLKSLAGVFITTVVAVIATYFAMTMGFK